jgi:hypothetical protein
MQIKHKVTGKILFENDSKNISECITDAINVFTDLSRADLSMANLSMANLTRADLSRANLSMADLSMANLSMANLSMANLTMANLSGANLTGANIDFASLPLWCGSKDMIVDERQAKQIAMHTFNLIEKMWPGGLTDQQKAWINESHRIVDGSFDKF